MRWVRCEFAERQQVAAELATLAGAGLGPRERDERCSMAVGCEAIRAFVCHAGEHDTTKSRVDLKINAWQFDSRLSWLITF